METVDKGGASARLASPIKKRMVAPESWMALLLLWLVYAMDANSRQMLFAVLPSITKEFGTSAATIGLYATIITMSTALIAIPTMIWADKGGHGWRRKYRHLPIVIGYTLFTCLTGLNVLTASIGVLVALQVLSHAFGGAGESIEVTSLAEWWSKERRGLALGIHHTGYPWGTLIGGFAISGLLSVYGPENWRIAFLFFPIPMVIVFALYWWYCSEKRYDRFHAHVTEAGETPPLSPDLEHGAGAPKGSFGVAMKNPNISIIALVSLLAIVGYFGISFWLPQYLAFVAHYNFAEAAAYSVLFTITGGVGQIVWGWISDRLGRKLCLMIVFIWLAIGMLLFKYSYMSLGTLVAIQLFAGFALNAPYTLVYAIAFDSTKPGTTGIAGAIINVGIYLGGFGPFVIGALIGAGGGFGKAGGYNDALYFIAGLMVIAFFLTAFFTRETTGWFRKHDRALVSRAVCNVE
ncbi:major facilitator transporter [Caballeronia choica]|uniref:Major facilitator transporter n=1 Tax=Caballeronia choica TaxID=326476 RepID=A0A158KTQ5_9BURK|nr:MFS transporter [Caballeronia choica]SAL84355.1 major facilitator transporter [Caballeronia choica]